MPLINRRNFVKATASMPAALYLSSPRSTLAADFPSRLITMVLTTAAGGGITDTRTRIILQWFENKFKISTAIDNTPGAAGVIAVRKVTRAKADGYTLLTASDSTVVYAAVFRKERDFEPLQDLTPISQIAVQPTVLFVTKNSPLTTFDDFVERAKKNPGQVKVAVLGANSSYHLAAAAIAALKNIKINVVPYPGTPQFIVDMLGGRIDAGIAVSGTLASNPDELHSLLVASKDRSPLVPNVPCASDVGMSQLDMPIATGIFVSKSTPPNLVGQLDSLFKEMLQDPAIIAQFEKLRIDIAYLSSADYLKEIERQQKLVINLMKITGLQPI